MITTTTIGTSNGNGRVAAVTSLVLALVTAGCDVEKDIRRNEATVPTVASVVPSPQATVAVAIRTLFRERRNELEAPLDTLVLAEPSDLTFPDDEQIKLQVAGNEALARFASQLPGARGEAFYLYEPTGSIYWPSEYLYEGRPADFRCAFIVHLRKEGEHATAVEAIEYLPMIKVGRAFRIRHSGPGFYADIRIVEPTASDRRRVLEAIERGATR